MCLADIDKYTVEFRCNYCVYRFVLLLTSTSLWVIFIYHPDAILNRRTSRYEIDTVPICILMDNLMQKFKERLLRATGSYFDFRRSCYTPCKVVKL